MSNILNNAEQGCDSHEQPSSAIEVIIEPRDSDLGGFYVRRALPTRQKRMVGPWIFFDEMGPADFPPGEGVNVAPHPHIGLSTVTYLFDGEMLHRDSIGSYQIIKPGDINLMVAGRGVTHSERERPEITAREHRLHGLQLWLALPEQYEQTEPAFYHIPSTDIPSANVNGVSVRVMIGQAYGVKSPVPTLSETLYVEARLGSGQELTLPTTDELAVYIVSGRLNSEGKELVARTLVVLKTEEQPVITAQEPSHIVIIGGNVLGNRFINWNFVSSDKERIEQARKDWQNQRFNKVVGDEDEFIPLP
ncbi:pirin family protein [Idiomarina sp.]|uniref:pirin family protein n=1 Tax=Idiomarina sp. TaxID=1874361 RepID=UPI003A94BE62